MSGEIIFPEKSSAPASPAADLHKLYVDDSGDANLINEDGDVRKVSSTLGEIMAMYQGLPNLRGFWPMSASTSVARDLGGGGFHLTAASVPMFGYDGLVPYAEYDGTNDAHYYADNAQFDITGTEANVVAAQRGLTLGCWFKTDDLSAANKPLITKWYYGTSDRSYRLRTNLANINFDISTDGASPFVTVSTVGSLVGTTQWHLVICRYVPSTTSDIYLDGTKTTLAAGIPASLKSGTAELNIGVDNDRAGAFFDGKISMAFICAAALSDTMIDYIWQQSRSLYGR